MINVIIEIGIATRTTVVTNKSVTLISDMAFFLYSIQVMRSNQACSCEKNDVLCRNYVFEIDTNGVFITLTFQVNCVRKQYMIGIVVN